MGAALAIADSQPTLQRFVPFGYQMDVINLIRRDWDYRKGTPEILLSGSYGSAKSTLIAHLMVTHCLDNPGARGGIGRKAMPDLKKTILQEVLDHIEYDPDTGEGLIECRTLRDLRRGKGDYYHNRQTQTIHFANGSELIYFSWHDKRYKKFRSLKLSALAIEEIVENNDEDFEAFKTLKARLRRVPGIKENFLIAATNPDAPAHWVHKYWMESDAFTRFVFYSVTSENPHLDPIYIEQLQADLTPREADRYIRGLWVELNLDRIYYEYDSTRQFLKSQPYVPDLRHPIYVSWDFNIGEGKPLSCVLLQYIDGTFHIFDEVVVEGMRTLGSCDELSDRGLLDWDAKYIICGDATGRHRDTRNNKSDYDLIKGFFSNYVVNGKDGEEDRHLDFEIRVPKANPSLRNRHNLVNRYCKNDLGQVRLYVYQNAKTADEGLRLAALKKGGLYVEDDSKHFQHITTAVGYAMHRIAGKVAKKSRMYAL